MVLWSTKAPKEIVAELAPLMMIMWIMKKKVSWRSRSWILGVICHQKHYRNYSRSLRSLDRILNASWEVDSGCGYLWILAKMGGDIKVYSQVNEGTQFVALLKCSVAAVKEESQNDVIRVMVYQYLGWQEIVGSTIELNVSKVEWETVSRLFHLII